MTPPRILLALVAVISIAGCSSLQRTFGEMFGKTPPAPEGAAAASPEGTFYAGVGDLAVREKPSGSAKVVGKLELHEKVRRSRLEHGYAYVTADRSGLAGWVVNAQLLWRLPPGAGAAAPAVEKPGAGAPAEQPAPPAGEEKAEEAAESAPPIEPTPTDTPSIAATPTEAPARAATPTAPAASVFDPF